MADPLPKEILDRFINYPPKDPVVVETNPYGINAPLLYTEHYLGRESSHYRFECSFWENGQSVTVTISIAEWLSYDGSPYKEYAIIKNGDFETIQRFYSVNDLEPIRIMIEDLKKRYDSADIRLPQ